jgi:hypothetical protein
METTVRLAVYAGRFRRVSTRNGEVATLIGANTAALETIFYTGKVRAQISPPRRLFLRLRMFSKVGTRALSNGEVSILR